MMDKLDYEIEELRERAVAYRELSKTMRPLRYYLWLRTAKEAGPLLDKALHVLAFIVGICIGITVAVMSNCKKTEAGTTKPPAVAEVAHESR